MEKRIIYSFIIAILAVVMLSCTINRQRYDGIRIAIINRDVKFPSLVSIYSGDPYRRIYLEIDRLNDRLVEFKGVEIMPTNHYITFASPYKSYTIEIVKDGILYRGSIKFEFGGYISFNGKIVNCLVDIDQVIEGLKINLRATQHGPYNF